MTREEFQEKIKQINNIRDNQLRELYQQFATENNTFEVGDIVQDNGADQNFFIIEKFKSVYLNFGGIPEMTFVGRMLKKDLTPTKKMNLKYYINHALL